MLCCILPSSELIIVKFVHKFSCKAPSDVLFGKESRESGLFPASVPFPLTLSQKEAALGGAPPPPPPSFLPELRLILHGRRFVGQPRRHELWRRGASWIGFGERQSGGRRWRGRRGEGGLLLRLPFGVRPGCRAAMREAGRGWGGSAGGRLGVDMGVRTGAGQSLERRRIWPGASGEFLTGGSGFWT